MNPVLLHIPHASTLIPNGDKDLYIVPEERLAQENLKLADLYTDQLYILPGAGRAVFPVSRFLVDAERFSEDNQESMAARGMGALYKVATDLTPIRPEIPEDRRTDLLDRFYWPHHHALDDMARARLERFGECLLFDCHSYPSKPLPYELGNMTLPRPEIGIGTDSFHTSPELKAALADAFIERGYEVMVDTPFSGSLAPNAFYGREPRLQSIMIEVRKDLYMDELTGVKNSGFSRVCADLTGIMTAVARKILKTPL